MDKSEKHEYFRQDAKRIVDKLFDTKMLREDITRDQMNTVEELIHFLMDSKYVLEKKADKLIASLEKKNN